MVRIYTALAKGDKEVITSHCSWVRWTLSPAVMIGALAFSLIDITSGAEVRLSDDASPNAAFPNLTNGPSLSVRSGRNSYIKFDLSNLPAGLTGPMVTKATLRVWVDTASTPGSFNVVRVTGPWAENAITATSLPSLGAAEASNISVTGGNRFIDIDLTNLVKGWLTSPTTNHGIALVANGATVVELDSKENRMNSHEPQLLIFPEGPAGPMGPAGATGARKGRKDLRAKRGPLDPRVRQVPQARQERRAPQGLQDHRDLRAVILCKSRCCVGTRGEDLWEMKSPETQHTHSALTGTICGWSTNLATVFESCGRPTSTRTPRSRAPQA